MAPLNIQKQNTIDEQGRIIPKGRLSHNQSFKGGSGTSVNSRVRKEELLPCRFGHLTLHQTPDQLNSRSKTKLPGLPIISSKFDCKSAYRRMHLNAETAIQTCTQLPDLGLTLKEPQALLNGESSLKQFVTWQPESS